MSHSLVCASALQQASPPPRHQVELEEGRCGGTSVQIVRQLLGPLGPGKDGVPDLESSELKQIVSVEGEGYRGAVYPR